MMSFRLLSISLGMLTMENAMSFVVNDAKASLSHSKSRLGISAVEPPVVQAKETIIELLKSGQDESSPTLSPYLKILQQSFVESQIDARYSQNPVYDGDWENVNTPAFQGRLGLTPDGLPLYTIGRLTFNQIPSAKDVVCTVEKMIQRVHPYSEIPAQVPESLQATLDKYPHQLRSNQIDTLFHVPDSPIRGILRMEGYTLPNEEEPNKYDTWFLGGRCLPQEGVSFEEWAKLFAGKLEYSLSSPMVAYQTVIYLDETLRVSVGNRGTVMIVQRE